MITASVEWGYELHSVKLSNRVWEKILSGEKHIEVTTGYYEGEDFDVTWAFNTDPEDTLIVSYGDDGGVGFIGTIADLIVSAE